MNCPHKLCPISDEDLEWVKMSDAFSELTTQLRDVQRRFSALEGNGFSMQRHGDQRHPITPDVEPMTRTLKLISEITAQRLARLEVHAIPDGARAVVRYPYDGLKYEVTVKPIKEEVDHE